VAGNRPTEIMATQALTRPMRAVGEADAPHAASARRYLRSRMPAIYHDRPQGAGEAESLADRFIASLEQVLDPIVATMDNMPALLQTDVAPSRMLTLMAAWLGVAEDERGSMDERREAVRFGSEIANSRGTLPGLELGLRTAFPSLPLRVEDTGGVTYSVKRGSDPEGGNREFFVYCDTPIPVERQAAVARAIERLKPVNARYRLRVKSPPRPKPKDPS
jgi:phage tail-like protein